MDTAPRLVLLGVSHHATPLPVRERLSIAPERVPELYRALGAIGGVSEAVLLNTCNRLEIYAVATAPAEAALEQTVCTFQSFPADAFERHRFVARDSEAVRHLLEVAAGADSQIVGETEIFGQVKTAFSTASSLGRVGPVLNRVFQKTFQAAKFIRSSTPIGEGQVSVATVAVDLAGKIFGELSGCRVLVVGTGEIGEKTLRALCSRGARSITVLSRIAARAETLAAAVGARAGMIETLPAELPLHDIVIGCTTTTSTPVIDVAMVQAALRQRAVRPLFLIDLGIPRNFEAATGEIDSLFLYDLDDLAHIADENLATRRAAVDRCRRLAGERAARVWDHVAARLDGGARPAAVLGAHEPAT